MQGFYTTPLSPNIGVMESGAMVARNVPIARIGYQEYLPEELGITSKHKVIKVYRSPEEVFAPSALKSFESVPVTDGHPPEFIRVDNAQLYGRGHVRDVRRDDDQVLATLVITDPTLISKIQNHTQRETSGGYNYKLYHTKCGKPTVAHEGGEDVCTCDDDDGLFEQRGVIANHCAIVTRGRAGESVAIQDACPPAICCPACESGGCLTHKHELSNSSGGTEGATATDKQPIKQKERPKPMAQQDWLRKVLGLGLKAVASEGSPEDIAFAAHAVHTATDSDPGAVARNVEYDDKALERATKRAESGMDANKGKDKMPDLSDHVDGCKCEHCSTNDAKMRRTLDSLAEFVAEQKKAKAASNESPLKAKEATGDAEGKSGEDPNMMEKWKSGVDAHMSEMRDKMATLHDGLSQLLKRGHDAGPDEEEAALKEGPEENSEEETGATSGRKSVDRKARDRRGKDEDMDENEEIPESMDSDEEESDVPPTQHETDPAKAAGQEEWEADNPKEGEDIALESAPEDSLKEGEIPKNPLPKSEDSKRARDTREALLREHNRLRQIVANPDNFRSRKAHDAAIESWNRQFRILNGKAPVKGATDRSYGDMNRTKKPENLVGMDGKPVQTEGQIAADYKDVTAAYGEWMRGGMKGPDPSKAKKSA